MSAVPSAFPSLSRFARRLWSAGLARNWGTAKPKMKNAFPHHYSFSVLGFPVPRFGKPHGAKTNSHSFQTMTR